MRAGTAGIIVCLGLAPGAAHASAHAAELWTNAGLELQLADELSVGVSEELRLNALQGRIIELNTQLSLAYDATRWLTVGAHYRADVEGWHDGLFLDHRFGIDLQVQHTSGPMQLSLRQRVQPEVASSAADPFRVVLRTRLRARLAASPALQPYLAIEPYLQADPQPWDRLRVDLGVRLPTAGLDLSYRLDEPLGSPRRPHKHILTVRYTPSLDLRRRRPGGRERPPGGVSEDG